jgi:hypothetical protein
MSFLDGPKSGVFVVHGKKHSDYVMTFFQKLLHLWQGQFTNAFYFSESARVHHFTECCPDSKGMTASFNWWYVNGGCHLRGNPHKPLIIVSDKDLASFDHDFAKRSNWMVFLIRKHVDQYSHPSKFPHIFLHPTQLATQQALATFRQERSRDLYLRLEIQKLLSPLPKNSFVLASSNKGIPLQIESPISIVYDYQISQKALLYESIHNATSLLPCLIPFILAFLKGLSSCAGCLSLLKFKMS